MQELTQEEVTTIKAQIDQMSQFDMVHTQRYAPAGSPMFCNDETYAHFQARLKLLGGITPEVSKAVGWGP